MNPETDVVLGTGMNNLDAKFQRSGLLSGSLVGIKGSPLSLADVVSYNFIGGRSTVYFRFGEMTDSRKSVLTQAGGITDEELTTVTFAPDVSPETVTERVTEQEIHEEMTLLVDPLNHLETGLTGSELAAVLRTLKEVSEETRSLCVLHLVETEDTPATRWVSLSKCDTVCTAIHDTSHTGVRESLAIERLHPLQSLIEDETRVFSLSRDLHMDIDTRQSLAP